MRLAVLADIHGNLPALEAVEGDLRQRGIDAVVNLGDCVSGPLWPRETLDRLRTLAWPTVRGNHDRWVGAAGTMALSGSDSFAAEAVGEAGQRWLAALPDRLDLRPGLLAVHARPTDDDAYLLEDVVDGRLRPADPATVAARLGACAASMVLTAHSHQAALVHLPDGRTIVNPGSVGAPAYDDPTPPIHVSETNSPAARYAVIEIDPAGGKPVCGAVMLIALPYDHGAAARRAAALNRPEWAHALSHGTMPRAPSA